MDYPPSTLFFLNLLSSSSFVSSVVWVNLGDLEKNSGSHLPAIRSEIILLGFGATSLIFLSLPPSTRLSAAQHDSNKTFDRSRSANELAAHHLLFNHG